MKIKKTEFKVGDVVTLAADPPFREDIGWVEGMKLIITKVMAGGGGYRAINKAKWDAMRVMFPNLPLYKLPEGFDFHNMVVYRDELEGGEEEIIYEVDDVVRIVGNKSFSHFLPIGSLGIVKRVSKDSPNVRVLVYRDSGDHYQYINPKDLEYVAHIEKKEEN